MPKQIKNQIKPEYSLAAKAAPYHCDQRGQPLTIVSEDGSLAWQAGFDEWGNVLREYNPDTLQKLIRLLGQQ